MIREAVVLMLDRYVGVLKNAPKTPGPTGTVHLLWMCETAIADAEAMPEDKMNRWLGYVQGCLACAGLIDVEAERDFSRPVFGGVYDIMGVRRPKTLQGPGNAAT